MLYHALEVHAPTHEENELGNSQLLNHHMTDSATHVYANSTLPSLKTHEAWTSLHQIYNTYFTPDCIDVLVQLRQLVTLSVDCQCTEISKKHISQIYNDIKGHRCITPISFQEVRNKTRIVLMFLKNTIFE